MFLIRFPRYARAPVSTMDFFVGGRWFGGPDEEFSCVYSRLLISCSCDRALGVAWLSPARLAVRLNPRFACAGLTSGALLGGLSAPLLRRVGRRRRDGGAMVVSFLAMNWILLAAERGPQAAGTNG